MTTSFPRSKNVGRKAAAELRGLGDFPEWWTTERFLYNHFHNLQQMGFNERAAGLMMRFAALSLYAQ